MNTVDIVTESALRRPGELNVWTASRIKKWLRKYSLGPGKTAYGIAKNRYRVEDISRAQAEMLDAEPKDEHGYYKDEAMRVLFQS